MPAAALQESKPISTHKPPSPATQGPLEPLQQALPLLAVLPLPHKGVVLLVAQPQAAAVLSLGHSSNPAQVHLSKAVE